jgi:hypothetical protein
MSKYPEWATEKQLEGMKEASSVIQEYGNFDIEYRPGDSDEEYHDFYIDLTWHNSRAEGERQHELHVGWDWEPTWDRNHEQIEFWQFVFCNGDVGREISGETLYLDLFQWADRQITVKDKA